jgi:transglutaminase-like putative cysteine protease
MCLDGRAIGGVGRWNWDGDAVVFDTTVPSQRPAVGGKRHYDIDVREFLLTPTNAVIRRTLREKLRPYAASLRKGGDDLFEARIAGAFDFRAHLIERWVAEHVRYLGKQGRDPWQFPDETLTLGAGDCEDRAFVLASLLLGSGLTAGEVPTTEARCPAAPRRNRRRRRRLELEPQALQRRAVRDAIQLAGQHCDRSRQTALATGRAVN